MCCYSRVVKLERFFIRVISVEREGADLNLSKGVEENRPILFPRHAAHWVFVVQVHLVTSSSATGKKN
jgi:hypothetical protein